MDEMLTTENFYAAAQALIFIAVGLALGKLVGRGAKRLLSERMEAHTVMVMQKVSYYAVLTLFLVAALHQLGFNLGVLLGAAGVMSVAIGFASQTSASNLISGLFLLWERPFSLGDVIRIGSTTGEVIAIDPLSVKLRTFDNLFVRIPNESMIKSEVTTLTKFPIRRVDLQIGVAYKEDIERVRHILEAVADKNPLCLDEPKPLYIFEGFGDSSINLQFSVWALKENFLEVKNSMQEQIKSAFDAEGIEIPFPHRTIYTGAVTAPFPVTLGKTNPGC